MRIFKPEVHCPNFSVLGLRHQHPSSSIDIRGWSSTQNYICLADSAAEQYGTSELVQAHRRCRQSPRDVTSPALAKPQSNWAHGLSFDESTDDGDVWLFSASNDADREIFAQEVYLVVRRYAKDGQLRRQWRNRVKQVIDDASEKAPTFMRKVFKHFNDDGYSEALDLAMQSLENNSITLLN
ncbi:hypothetical protein MRB53_041501 [Persea americana]|nr:hypothetical protein MRB53_041501 [Persea americana]